MSVLAEFCQRLRTHFDSLAVSRAEVGARVYALEHPLTFDELEELQHLVATSCRDEGLAREHRLAWIVLATECGYEYSGTQYWPMLEKRIPAWQFRHREVLRGFFESFARDMRGAVPAGVWARHFNVIAWPITNAILPRDLQVFLSHSVYLSRYYLGRSHGLSNAEVGKIVAEHAYSHGDRFVRFLNQFDFVGSLVKQLLHMDADLSVFEERTFRRIVADLESHAEARYWLREARTQVKPKIRISPSSNSALTLGGTSSQNNPTLAPGVVMRANAHGKWELYVQPPSLIQFLQEHPELANQVAQCGFSVLGNETQAFRLRDLLNASPRERPLSVFPKPNQPLLECEPGTAPFAHQLREESVLAPRSIWVFRFRKDGSAWLQSTPTLSPGGVYLLAQQESQSTSLPGSVQESNLQEFRLSKFEVPRTLTDQDTERFGELGLTIRRRTTVSAWGILPRQWCQGESAEYVEGEPIFFRIERDHAFDALRCEVGAEKLEVDWSGSGDMLLEIGNLPLGQHEVRIDTCKVARSGGCTTRVTLSSALLRLTVRSPSVWVPDRIPDEALAISLVPTEPTLTEILSGKAKVSVRGQAGVPVRIELVLSDDQNETRHEVVRRKPPIDEAEWELRLSKVTKEDGLALRALGADRGHLAVTCETFGSHRLPIGIFAGPVRWIASREGSQQVRLRVRCDGIDVPKLLHFSFDDPGAEREIDFELAARGIDSANGLYLAQSEEEIARVIVSSPPKAVHGFGGLSAVTGPRFPRQMSARALIQACRDWAKAPIVGKLADMRRDSIVSVLHRQLVAMAAGQDWARLEQKVSNGNDLSALDPRVSPRNRNFGITLGMRSGLNSHAELFEAFRSASTDYRISNNEDLIRLAWRVGFEPSELSPDTELPPTGSGEEFSDLTRGARLLRLHFDRRVVA